MNYTKEYLLDVAEALDGYEKTINVGPVELEGHDTLIPTSTAEAAAIIRNYAEALDAMSVFACWWTMHEAERELVGDPPWKDDAVILSYMGCGASTTVTAGDIRRMLGVKK
jgi:hypothetical protein